MLVDHKENTCVRHSKARQGQGFYCLLRINYTAFLGIKTLNHPLLQLRTTYTTHYTYIHAHRVRNNNLSSCRRYRM